MNTKINDSDFLEIPQLRIKVQKEASGEMSLEETKEYCENHNARRLTFLEARYIFCHDLIKDFCKEREWLEPCSKKTIINLFGDLALVGGRDSKGTLVFDEVYGDDIDFDHAFKVRLVYPME